MNVQFPLNVIYNDHKKVITFIKTHGFNPAESLLKYLEEEFPYAPTVELLSLVLPELREQLALPETQLEEADSETSLSDKALPDDAFWERVNTFRGAYPVYVQTYTKSREALSIHT